MEKRKSLGLQNSETLIALDGVKELAVEFNSNVEPMYRLVIRDGSGMKSVSITKELYEIMVASVSPKNKS